MALYGTSLLVSRQLSIRVNIWRSYSVHSDGCPWDEYYICMVVAGSGNLEILQWLHSQDSPMTEWTWDAADRSGNLEMLQLLHSAGYQLDDEEDNNDDVHEGGLP
jgi:hypothetical protein